eukprot:NODE_2067_length_775_cov_73.033058_g1656_i0.p1 GENE.NODE_2067_length_775_cov_73.033058_g1656_i0~~NODE_2067_length_775_cov_73.033058_g1656_i0.p1  ORF type:complete len:129 (-),score=31.67 NODE_2067_length_775_cov_73.033058_g1656_i0:318-704(-)
MDQFPKTKPLSVGSLTASLFKTQSTAYKVLVESVTGDARNVVLEMLFEWSPGLAHGLPAAVGQTLMLPHCEQFVLSVVHVHSLVPDNTIGSLAVPFNDLGGYAGSSLRIPCTKSRWVEIQINAPEEFT